MKDNNIAYLTITTWVGTCAWRATHYYGKITCQGKKIEVERVLSQKDAEELNASEKDRYADQDIFHSDYAEGETTERFTSEKSLIDAAKSQYKNLFPQAEFLIQGESYIAQAQQIIDGDINKPEVKRINEIYQEGEEINGWEGNPKRMRIIMDEWRELFKKLIKEPDDNNVNDEEDEVNA